MKLHNISTFLFIDRSVNRKIQLSVAASSNLAVWVTLSFLLHFPWQGDLKSPQQSASWRKKRKHSTRTSVRRYSLCLIVLVPYCPWQVWPDPGRAVFDSPSLANTQSNQLTWQRTKTGWMLVVKRYREGAVNPEGSCWLHLLYIALPLTFNFSVVFCLLMGHKRCFSWISF